MRKIVVTFIILLAAVCSSCSDWLDVKPSDRVSEENNFSDIAGFKKALNGIYVELNSSDLYGRNLTVDFVEVLAQRYAIGTENTGKSEIMKFQYAGSTAKSIASSIWSKAYTLIANANLILKNCEEHRSVLPEEYYHLIKGETLALRAYLHFDLFRLFGPVYSADETISSIPYYEQFNLNVAPSLPADEFLQHVLGDLLNAETELKDDPVIAYGVKGNKKDVFLTYRNLRLNYYAVQAMLARVYLYAGNPEEALKYAEKIIEVQEEKFPWITPMKLTGASKDKVFSTEVLFALQNLERETLFTSLFDGQSLKLQTLLAPREDVVNEVFDNEKVDYRYMASLSTPVEIAGTTYSIFNKYQGRDSLYNQMIPMLRVSEMYLLAAEASAQKADRTAYFNTLRNHRGLSGVSNADYYIEDEWQREFYGEGQLFFYYKRMKKTEVQSSLSPYETVKVSMSNYVIPIPDGENKYN